MKPINIFTNVKDGKIIYNRELLSASLELFEGKSITITIQESKKQRSNDQNSYYWSVVLPFIVEGIAELQGEPTTSNEIHKQMKRDFNDGNSTTELNPKQFNEYLNKVVRFASEFLNITIPEPNDHDR